MGPSHPPRAARGPRSLSRRRMTNTSKTSPSPCLGRSPGYAHPDLVRPEHSATGRERPDVDRGPGQRSDDQPGRVAGGCHQGQPRPIAPEPVLCRFRGRMPEASDVPNPPASSRPVPRCWPRSPSPPGHANPFDQLLIPGRSSRTSRSSAWMWPSIVIRFAGSGERPTHAAWARRLGAPRSARSGGVFPASRELRHGECV